MTRTIATANVAGLFALAVFGAQAFAAPACDKKCMEDIGDQYRAAYLKHDPKLAPLSKKVRFTENNVEMQFPDGTWDTVTQEIGTPLTLSDTKTHNVGIYTRIIQNDTPGFLAVRLKVEGGQITEIEHIISTRRNLSSPPTPIGDVNEFKRDPDYAAIVPARERASRERLLANANGYFDTLQHNNGEIRGTRFSPEATRFENGMKFPEIEKGFKTGRYLFNERVRDRDCFVLDEERSVAMCRGFIDHKGVMDEYTLTDGTKNALRFPRAAYLVVPREFQGSQRHDRRRRGHFHWRAVLHPLAVDDEARPTLKEALR
ncbi:MAG: hypothetical protein WDO56_12870 [Gammaproteobacteria bacterium]